MSGRLWRAGRGRLAGLGMAVTLGLACANCSFSYQLGSLFEKDEAKLDETGSIAPVRVSAAEGDAPTLPPATDLAYAKAAAAELLGRGDKDSSQSWENPRTGARGTVTPLAAAHTQDGFTCRDFLASYVHSGAETWMQGEACRMHRGRWEVRSLKPWKRS